MNIQEWRLDPQNEEVTVSHYRLVGNEREKVSVVFKHPATDDCASCRIDEVMSVMGSQNVGA